MIGVWRILKGWPLHLMIACGYVLVVIMTAIAPPEIIGIAYDSGGVTTSTITVPLVTALGVGLATVAGMIAAPVSSVYPNMGSQVLIMCFVVVVIGGIGSVRGALTAALLVGLVDTFGKVLLPQFASMLVYVLMALVLLYKPEGLFKQ